MTRFKVQGMCCAEETAILRKVVGGMLDDADRLRFDILNGVMSIQGGVSEKETRAIVDAVAGTGMKAVRLDAEADTQDVPVSFWKRHGRTLLTVLSGVGTLLGWVLTALHQAQYTNDQAYRLMLETNPIPLGTYISYGVAIASGLWIVLPRAWYALRTFRPDMNLLMTIAVAGAIGIDEWFEAATISFLFALSLLLESWSIGRARKAISALMELAPMTARKKESDDRYIEVPPDEISIGDMLLVKPGEKIPLDGRVASGAGRVNQAPVTGESIPVEKSFGDPVYAGTISVDGALEIVAVRPASESTFANIVRMVEDAGSRRSRSERWVEKFARIYTPAILVLAFLVLVVPPLLFGGAWGEWTYRSLVILVIGCPCALVISTPVSIVAGLASAARNGVLIKGGEFLEIPGRLRAVAFDKTGTLTRGNPGVTQVIPLNGHNEHELLERASAMEANSHHPLAKAIVRHAEEIGVPPLRAESFQNLDGKGALAEFRGRQYWLGSRNYLSERPQTTPDVERRAGELAEGGSSVVAIGSESHVCGLIGIADSIREDASAMVRQLQEIGVECAMLTGDNTATAEAIGKEAGVANVFAELLPDQKVGVLEQMVERYGVVAMVGDGVNDAPAMARSSLGIAMGVAGTDVALETADVALMSDDLSKIPWLVRHSRRTVQIIRQNVAFALAIKLAFFGATLFGFATLWGAIAADIGATLVVTANALRLMKG